MAPLKSRVSLEVTPVIEHFGEKEQSDKAIEPKPGDGSRKGKPIEQKADADTNVDTEAEAEAEAGAQAGIKQIEAVTQAWSTKALIGAYVLIWLTYFSEGILSGVSNALGPFVTSAFASHSLTPTTYVLSSVIGGVSNLTIAKLLDVFGRPQGYTACVVIATVGLVMMAACNTVEAFAAAQVFYTVGNNGLQFSLSVFVADTTSLRNRALVQAILTSPNLITCWLAGPISAAFLQGPGWRWFFGAFSIVIPGIAAPLAALFMLNYRKAKRAGIAVTETVSGTAIGNGNETGSVNEGGAGIDTVGGLDNDTQRTWTKSFLYYCREFDAMGLLLLSAGVALFLLPFNLYTLQAKGWESVMIICFLVFGVVLVGLFVLWEAYAAPVTMFPYRLLKDRTVLGACLLSASLFVSYYCWSSYFSSFLQVVNGLSVEHASYVIQAYSVGVVLTSIAMGWLIRRTGHFKPASLYIGIPLSVLGLGLMIYFREPDAHVGYLVMCQIFISVGAGAVIMSDEIAILAAASHQYVAMAIAVLGLFGSIGGAIGLTISAAIWQNTLPKRLALLLPPDELAQVPLIYADINTQLSYPIGSPERMAIQSAYGDAQRLLLIAATAVWAAGLFSVLLLKDINVKTIRQTKGHVF